MKEYKMAKVWAIFMYIVAPLMIALFTFILFLPLMPGMENEITPTAYWFVFPVSLAMISVMVIGLIDTYKGKFVIEKGRVYSEGVFSRRELLFHEIKGYRLADKYIFIEPTNENKKRIKISTYFGKTNEIIQWLQFNSIDLDKFQVEKEVQDILNNQEFGINKQEREAKLNEALKTAKIVNWIGAGIAVWTILFPKPYEYAIVASIAFPIVCLFIVRYYKGLMRIDSRKDSGYPSLFGAIFGSSIGLLLRCILDFNIFDYTNVWLPSVVILLIFLTILCVRNNEFVNENSKINYSIFFLTLFIYGYSYSTVVTLNCIYDTSEPIVYDATVLSKRINSGKTTTYYLELTPWGPSKQIEEISVSKDLYNSVNRSSEVNIYFLKGRFDIPWFEVTEK